MSTVLTEMGHYTEAIKRYLTILASLPVQEGKSHFQLWGEMTALLVSKAITRVPMQELMWI
jgi:hypothetical protein